MSSFKFALRANEPLEQIAGQYTQPKLRVTTDLAWYYDDFQVGLYNRYLGDHGQDEDFAFFNSQEGAKIPSHNEWDLRFEYTGFPLVTLSVGIENFTNEEIPLDWFRTEGYDTSFYNNRGRFIYTQAGFRF